MAIKKLIWLYFLLLLFEGAVRKWLLPQFDTALLLVRDPIVMAIYFLAWQRGIFPRNPQLLIGVLLVCLTGAISLIGGMVPAVVLFGMRVNILHLPLIWVIPRVFDRDDVLKMGRFLLYIAVPMAVLIVYQFRSPQGSWINIGAFATQYDTVRPSATFPFVTGTAIYLAFVVAYLAYGFVQKGRIPVWLGWITTPAVLAALAVSGSRLAVTSVALVSFAAIAAVIVRGRGFGGIIGAGAAIAVAALLLGHTSFYQEGQSQLDRRFDDASPDAANQASFLTSRVSGDTAQALQLIGVTSFFGNGTGAGTSVGAQMLAGQRIFLGAEGEMGRLIWESGPILGTALVLFRCWVALSIGLTCYQALRRGEFLPILLFGACVMNLVQGQWGVTNIQGFACLQAGLALAACRPPRRILAPSIRVEKPSKAQLNRRSETFPVTSSLRRPGARVPQLNS
ncbi:MAG: hypothetical protein PHC88_07830 [Terrimicrobiaceae bacterium]|nr:hypothetical protein [Terrimicrobiaceae bacterium]